MGQEKDKLDGAFRETRILIANSRIASTQAALARVDSELEKIMTKKIQLEMELKDSRETRDRLLIEGWPEGKPDWTKLLALAGKTSDIMTAKAFEEAEKLGLCIAGDFEKNQQRALGMAVSGEITDDHIDKLAVSLETIFPYLIPLTDNERAVLISHDSQESFSLQIRQHVINGAISVAVLSYGNKFSAYYSTFREAISYLRDCMKGKRFTMNLYEDLE